MLLSCRVQVVAGSHNAAEAYAAVPQLHAGGDKQVQNIRKRARKQLEGQEAAAPVAAAAITCLSAAQLAQLQVAIAQQLQASTS